MAATEIKVQMQQRRDTATGWTAANPTLLSGEFGYETDTGKFKIGDGSTAWSSLSYIPGFSVSSYPLSTADIANDAITADKLANTSVIVGTYRAADITVDAQGRITSAANGSISTSEIEDDAVTADKLAHTSVTAGSYTAADITVDAQGRITAAASGTVGTAELADDSVTGDKLANDITIANDLTVTNNLTVNGTTTTINSTTLQVDDKNIELGTVATPSDLTADGGGITLKGATDHTIIWTNSTDSWDFSEHVNIASGKEFQIAGTSVLNATTLGSGVTASSLTSVGTITTGTWNGTAIDAAYLDSTVVTTGDTGTVTSTMISDGTIVDADINASAAIAGTKIDADFGAQDLTVDTNVLHVDATNDRVGIGTTSPSDLLHISDDGGAGILIERTGAPAKIQTNFGGGDAAFKYTVNNANSYIVGIDDSDGDEFKISYGSSDNAAFGTNDYLKIESNGTTRIGANIFAQNAFAEFNRSADTGYGLVRLNVSSQAMHVSDGTDTNIILYYNGNADFDGAVSKGSGSFRIDHPLKPETHQLVHSFVEAPDASNLYAGMINLVNGTATVNIDAAHRMTEGTFEALNHLQSWSSSNESGYAPVKSSISGNLLTIECQDPTSTDTVYYEVRGIRKDQHMLDTHWTDENGRVITEPLKPAEETTSEPLE